VVIDEKKEWHRAMKIIVEGPAGYPIDEPRRLARIVVEALRQHPDMHGAVVNADEDHETFAYAGLIVEVESRVEGGGKAAELLRQIVNWAGALTEDMDAGDALGEVRNAGRLRAVLEDADQFHHGAGGGVAVGDLADFLVAAAIRARS
jgi:hypothetical protein